MCPQRESQSLWFLRYCIQWASPIICTGFSVLKMYFSILSIPQTRLDSSLCTGEFLLSAPDNMTVSVSRSCNSPVFSNWYAQKLPEYLLLSTINIKCAEGSKKFLLIEIAVNSFKLLKHSFSSCPHLKCPDFTILVSLNASFFSHGMNAFE